MRLAAAILFFSGVVACSSVACSSAPPKASSVGAERSESIDFAFGVLDGTVLTDEATRGRVTALLFVTSFDLPSQATARRIAEIQRTHQPRFNAAAIALESAENATLVAVFRDTLALPYPVAIADRVELQSAPAFADIDRVPTLVLLDRYGRVVLRHSGGFDGRTFEAWLREAER